jgi:hypothetical protein
MMLSPIAAQEGPARFIAGVDEVLDPFGKVHAPSEPIRAVWFAA